MKCVVMGAGAMGLLYAAKLAAAGCEVAIVTRTEAQRDSIRSGGVSIERPGQDARIVEIKALAVSGGDAETVVSDADWLLLTVKQPHITDGFARMLGERLGAQTRVACFQNGIGHLETLGAYVPHGMLFAAVTTEAAKRESGRAVVHTGAGTTRIGPYRGFGGHPDEEPQKKLRAVLEIAGFAVLLSNEMESIVWHKLVINAVINPLTALLGVANGTLPDLPEARSLMRELFAEAAAVAERESIRLGGELWDDLLDVCRRTALNRSSMLQDIENGRATEIDWINGGLLRIAERHGMPLPANRTVYRLVKAKEYTMRI